VTSFRDQVVDLRDRLAGLVDVRDIDLNRQSAYYEGQAALSRLIASEVSLWPKQSCWDLRPGSSTSPLTDWALWSSQCADIEAQTVATLQKVANSIRPHRPELAEVADSLAGATVGVQEEAAGVAPDIGDAFDATPAWVRALLAIAFVSLVVQVIK